MNSDLPKFLWHHASRIVLAWYVMVVCYGFSQVKELNSADAFIIAIFVAIPATCTYFIGKQAER